MVIAKQNTTSSMILGLVAIAGILVATYFIVAMLWEGLSSLDPRIGAGIASVVIGGVIAGAFRMRLKRIDEAAVLREQLRDKKIPTLEQLVAMIFDAQFAAKKGNPPLDEKELIKRMVNITQELVIWGSDDMLNAYHTFREATFKQAAGTAHPMQTVYAVEDLLMAIRKDVGHKNKDLKRGSILRLFINDLPPL